MNAIGKHRVDKTSEMAHLRGRFCLNTLRIIALEDLDQIKTESEYTEAVENLEINGSGWVSDRIVSMSIDLYKKKTQGGRSYVELPIRYLSVLNIQTEDNTLCGIWCIREQLHLQK